ncbi:MAG: putative DNA-binding transcriptional regulator AlpA [Arenicella sp.]|jgi:predicted DNA-binding transcriptional regulator AlpA
MSQPFPDHYKEIADGMGVSLYQKFSLGEASLFLRCPKEQLEVCSEIGDIESIQLPAGEVQFFGYQLVSYLISHATAQPSQNSPKNTSERIIRAKEVHNITGLSRTSIWRHEKKGTFPKRVQLGESSVGWKLSEVQTWINSR